MRCILRRLKNFFLSHLYGIALALGTAGLAIFLNCQGQSLQTDMAPQGIVSLELAGSATQAEAIVKSWSRLQHEAAIQLLWDLPFIVVYSLALFHFGLWASRQAHARDERVLAWAARAAGCAGLLAGLFDLIEDWGLWCELHGGISDAVAARTAFAATTKFMLIAAAVGIPLFVGFARQDFTMPFTWTAMFRIARATVAALAIVALGLIVPPQTQDMLAGMSWHTPPEAWSGFAFHVSLFLLAFCAWHWSRAALSAWFEVSDTPAARDAAALVHGGAGIDPVPLEWMPRLLFAVAAGIGLIAALRSAAWWHATAIIIWTGVALYVLYRRLDWRLYWRPTTPWLDPLGGIGNLLRRAPLGAYLAIGLFALGILAFVAGLIASLIPGSGVLNFLVRWIAWVFPGPSAVLLFLALALGPLTLLSYAADRLRWGFNPFGLEWLIRPPVFLVLLAIVLVVPTLVDLHAVRVARSPAIGVADRAKLGDLFAAWFDRCVKDKKSGTPVRPIIVAISGGASRAGLWGARVLAEADAAAGEAGIFAVSSVSGGSLGAAAYLAIVAGQKDRFCGLTDENRARFRDAAFPATGNDALGPALAGALFGDIPRALFGVPLTVVRHAWAALWGKPYQDSRGGDRAEALERAFERNWSSAVQGELAADPKAANLGAPLSFARPFLMLAYDPEKNPADGKHAPRGGPLWIANGTDVQNGERILTAPFSSDDTQRWPFAGAHDALGLIGQDVPISTAINNTSRFPFLSPAGELSPVADRVGLPQAYAAQLIDGGYFENEGLLTAWELADYLENNGPGILKRDDMTVRPILIQATANADLNISEDSIVRCQTQGIGKAPLPPRERPAEALAGSRPVQALVPLLGLYSVRGGHSDWILRRVAQEYCGTDGRRFFHFYLYREDEDVPLNWVLSREISEKIWDAMEHRIEGGKQPNRAESECLSKSLARAAQTGAECGAR